MLCNITGQLMLNFNCPGLSWELITYNGDFPNQFFALLLEDGGGCSASTGAGGGIEPSHVRRLSVAQDQLVSLEVF